MQLKDFKMKKILCVFVCSLIFFCLTGCVEEIKHARMKDIYLVHKNYPQPIAQNNLSFAYAEPELTVVAEISDELKNGLYERLKYNSKNIACHLNGELDKIILSKGFTITDRFRSLQYMTFTEKRNTTALFYPDIKVKIVEKSDIENISTGEFTTSGTLEIDAEVNIIMIEPMSKEKIWIKSIPVQEITDSFQYNNAFWAGPYGSRLIRNTEYYKVGRGQKHDVPENLSDIAKKIDGFFEEIDEKIIESTMRFVDAEEFAFLNSDIRKLKTIKRY